MNLELYIFKTKLLMRFDRFMSKINAKYKAKKLYLFLCIKFPKQRQSIILERYLRMYNYKIMKKESFDRFVLNSIAITSDKSGISQYVLRDIADRILNK